MPETIKNQLSGNAIGRIRERTGGIYEIRCQIAGVKYSASAKSLPEARKKFIKKLMEAKEPKLELEESVPATSAPKLEPYMREWLFATKQANVKPSTFKDYRMTCESRIFPRLGEKEISSFTQLELQKFFNEMTESGRHRTARKIYLLLSSVFDYAIGDGIIERSPMSRVKLPIYEKKHGYSLSREEEAKLLELLATSPHDLCLQAYALLVYTGMRRSEIASCRIEDGWVHIQTSKIRKGKAEKPRALPISPMLARILDIIDVEAVKNQSVNTLTQRFHAIFPSHHLHDTRHTFITRAQECGIARPLVSLWAGHAADSSQTSTVYTHLDQNKENQIEEMKKFFYDL